MSKFIRWDGRILFMYFCAQLIRQVCTRRVTTSATDFFRRVRWLSSTRFTRFQGRSARVKGSSICIDRLNSRFNRFICFICTLTNRRIWTVRIDFVQECFWLVIRFICESRYFRSYTFAFLGPLARQIRIYERVSYYQRSAFVVFSFEFSVGLFPPFTCMIGLQTRVGGGLCLLTILMWLIADDNVGHYEIFYREGVNSADFLRINDAICRLLSVRSNCYGKRWACQDRRKGASSCVIESGREFMSFFVYDGTYHAFLNVYGNCSCFLYRLFTTLIFALFLRRTRYRDNLYDYAKFESVSCARFFVFRGLYRFMRVVFAGVITNVGRSQYYFLFLWPDRTI